VLPGLAPPVPQREERSRVPDRGCDSFVQTCEIPAQPDTHFNHYYTIVENIFNIDRIELNR
jgi:hypothetical protein